MGQPTPVSILLPSQPPIACHLHSIGYNNLYVTGSSPGNSLLQKCRERLRTIDPKWSDPSPDPAQAGATCTGLTLLKNQTAVTILTNHVHHCCMHLVFLCNADMPVQGCVVTKTRTREGKKMNPL